MESQHQTNSETTKPILTHQDLILERERLCKIVLENERKRKDAEKEKKGKK